MPCSRPTCPDIGCTAAVSFQYLASGLVMVCFTQQASGEIVSDANCMFRHLAVLSYFMSPVLESTGISGTTPQLNIILISSCQQFIFALIGATLVDRVGRRPLLLFSNIACSVVWMAICVSSSEFAKHGGTKDSPGTSPAAGAVTLAFIFIFGAAYSLGFTPLQALYPVEVLSFEMRAKGMAFQTLALNAGSFSDLIHRVDPNNYGQYISC